jgi:hypothetical protein
MEGAEHVALIERRRDEYRILVEKPKIKKQL